MRNPKSPVKQANPRLRIDKKRVQNSPQKRAKDNPPKAAKKGAKSGQKSTPNAKSIEPA
jgi:hypothetical protein